MAKFTQNKINWYQLIGVAVTVAVAVFGGMFWVNTQIVDLKADMRNIQKADVKADIKEVKDDLQKEITELKQDIKESRSKMWEAISKKQDRR